MPLPPHLINLAGLAEKQRNRAVNEMLRQVEADPDAKPSAELLAEAAQWSTIVTSFYVESDPSGVAPYGQLPGRSPAGAS